MLKKHKEICENHDYCKLKIPEEGKNILEYIPGEKSVMTPFVIYADLESILEKISGCENDPEKSSSTKTNKHKSPHQLKQIIIQSQAIHCLVIAYLINQIISLVTIEATII